MSTRSAIAFIVVVALASLGNSCTNVQIASPAPGSVFSTEQTVTVSAEVPDGWTQGSYVRWVDFHRNGSFECRDFTEPYECAWPITGADNGAHTWSVSADLAGLAPVDAAPFQYTVAINGATGTGDPELVGFIPSAGFARDVVVDAANDLAYVASNEFGLTVFDVSDPNEPVAIGAPVPPIAGTSVAVQGSLAVVGGEGVQVVDVSDPSSPRTIGSLDGVQAVGVAMSGQYAYVRISVPGNPAHNDLAVVSLQDPTNPVLLSQTYLSGGKRVRAVGSRVYVATGSAGLQIFDASNPYAPRQLGSVTVSGGARELAVEGNTAYVGNLSSVYAINVANPYNPSVVGSFGTGTTALAVANGRVHQVSGGNLHVVDFTNPAAPVLLGTGYSFNAWGTDVSGGLAYLASPASGGGLHVVDVSAPTAPQTVGEAPGTVGNAGIAAAGSLAVVNVGEGVQVVDVSNPSSPQAIGSLEGMLGVGVAMAGQFAYVRVSVPGNPAHTDLAIVSLQDPANPVLLSQTYLPGGDAVKVVGSRAYVSTGGALQIFDVSNPFGPRSLGSVSVPGGARELAVEGSYAYVGNLSAVYAIDISNPGNPLIVGTFGTGTTALTVSNGIVHQISGDYFHTVDFTNPAAPVLLGTGTSFNAWGIEVSGDLAFLASPAAVEGVIIYDVSDPTAPELSQQLAVPGAARSLCVVGDGLYVGDDAATVDVFQL